jgi:hypothetical protein
MIFILTGMRASWSFFGLILFQVIAIMALRLTDSRFLLDD